MQIEADIRKINSIEMFTKNDLNSSNIETCFVTKIKFWTVTLTTITYAKQKNKQKIKKFAFI